MSEDDKKNAENQGKDSSSETFQVSLAGATKDTPGPPEGATVSRMGELEKAGVYLAWGVLAILASLALVFLTLISVSEFSQTSQDVVALQKLIVSISELKNPPPTSEQIKLANETFALIRDAHKASRDFWTSLMQLILLNIFLPVLTAILGYIFGSRKSGNST